MADTKEVIAKRRSHVRVVVTYGAAIFLFIGGALLIGYLTVTEQHADAIGLFTTILPVSAAIISFWFGGRGMSQPEKKDESNPRTNESDIPETDQKTHEQNGRPR